MTYRLSGSSELPGFERFSVFPLSNKRAYVDSDDELAESPPQEKRRKAPVIQVEIVTGVNSEDLPIAGPSPKANIEYYAQLPVLRHLDWRKDEYHQPIRRGLENHVSLLAAFAHTRGQVAPEPCTHCLRGLGPWNSCVVGSDTMQDRPSHGACTNCRFSRRATCSIRECLDYSIFNIGDLITGMGKNTPGSNKDRESDGIRVSALFDPDFLSSRSSSFSGVNKNKRRSLSLGEGSVRKLKSESNTMSAAQVSRGQAAVVVVEDNQNEPNPEVSYLRSKGKCNLDGKVLPFPLGPKTIDNLLLLEQVVEDLTKHLDVIKKRVEQLKCKEQNPWDTIFS